jgi:hypothetical protein
MFIIIPVCGAPLLYLFAPETKGLSLEEVGACFGDEVALDLTHMDAAAREKFDQELVESTVKTTTYATSTDKHALRPDDEQVDVV